MNPVAYYELHATVTTPQEQLEYHPFYERFSRDCEEMKLKPIAVGVDYKDGFKKLAQTAQYIKTDLETAKQRVAGIGKQLEEKGYNVIRLKVEAVANSLKKKLEKTTDEVFFETHIIINLEHASVDANGYYNKGNELTRVSRINRDIFEKYGYPRFIPLSFNLKKPDTCFVTIRGYNKGYDEHVKDTDDTVSTLEKNGFSINKVIREITFYDTNQDVDSEPIE